MKDIHIPSDAVIKTYKIEQFAALFLKSPLAKAMLDLGSSCRFFVPVDRDDCAEWGGVVITIAGLRKDQIAEELATAAPLPVSLKPPQRGNGYSSNPKGPLKPGDYGVHSHPDTTKLLKSSSARD